MAIEIKRERPEFRMCETSRVRCQSTSCIEQNQCHNFTNNPAGASKDAIASAARYNHYIGWPEAGTPFDGYSYDVRRVGEGSVEGPTHRHCEGSSQKCQNTICLSTNICQLLLSLPNSVSVTAKSIAEADKINKKMGWPPAGTPL